MKFKKDIENLLSLLKAKGHDRGKIEDRLGYSLNAIDQSLSRGGSKKLLKAIELYNDWVLCNSIHGEGVNSDRQGFPRELNLVQIAASLQELAAAVNKIEKQSRAQLPGEQGIRNLKAVAKIVEKDTLSKKDRSGKD